MGLQKVSAEGTDRQLKLHAAHLAHVKRATGKCMRRRNQRRRVLVLFAAMLTYSIQARLLATQATPHPADVTQIVGVRHELRTQRRRGGILFFSGILHRRHRQLAAVGQVLLSVGLGADLMPPSDMLLDAAGSEDHLQAAQLAAVIGGIDVLDLAVVQAVLHAMVEPGVLGDAAR